jgi:hypothetical protein
MKPIPINEDTVAVARRVIWFEPPEQTLSDPVRLMAYAAAYARHEDMKTLRRHVSDDDFREALDRAPPGIIDARSWAYWNSKLGRFPPPPAPVRDFGAAPPRAAWPLGGAPADTAAVREAASVQAEACTAWRAARPAPEDLESVRRRGREEWRGRFGPKD